MNRRQQSLNGVTAALLLGVALAGCSDSQGRVDEQPAHAKLPSAAPRFPQGDFRSPLTFTNPYAHIPAQCHIETSRGTQNACLFCHTNGVYRLGLGNNFPQAGAEPRLGNLQLEYSFTPISPFTASPSRNPWENTLTPEKLREAVAVLGVDPQMWDMETYIREDNWRAAFQQRPGDPRAWDGGDGDAPFRLFPGLDPADLPADSDGFVRSSMPRNGWFQDGAGRWITGWRAVNFMPYGIFTPMTGSVSGIYLRLPKPFMQREDGSFDRTVYARNLDLLERAIQDRLRPEDGAFYQGAARTVALERGLYPVGTEFAHPLHYVDVAADGNDLAVSPYPGTRARRVKEIRYMYKWKSFYPSQFRPGTKEEGAPVYGNDAQGWVDNGVGWTLAGYIEDASGALRPQNREELAQCIGCHSGVASTEFPQFTSGVGNTVDSTWSLPRKFPGELDWREMDTLRYLAHPDAPPDATPGQAQLGDPVNRELAKGEFRHFLDNVVGASLYGDMPAAIERFLARAIQPAHGYSAAWPALDTASAAGFQRSQTLRQTLLRELTARGGYLTAEGMIRGEWLYPPQSEALAAARRYRQVVVTQRYVQGKDVFPATPVTFRYFREGEEGFDHQDGQPYQIGEVVADRPVDLENPASITYGVGNAKTLIDPDKPFEAGGTYFPEYVPLLVEPLRFESAPGG
ncbi:MAG: hypothetical protein F9K25_01920 [Candidatus Contendobacter sp.]|nr:MAG: hypothetical protein F9K25_01920 [Candidatus Contendobacter sp.]